jgi:hypothetical protein
MIRQACPSCPDGNEWSSQGPTGRACPTCKGKAYIGEDEGTNSGTYYDVDADAPDYPRTRSDELNVHGMRGIARALLAPSATTAPNDGWIAWDGYKLPAPLGTLMQVKFRDGTVAEQDVCESWVWNHFGVGSDILAYRIAPPAKEPT